MAKKSCFIITPLDAENSLIRRASDGLIDSVIEPVLKELDIICYVSHRISESGSITNQIIEHLLNDSLVIANLTGMNPNVMYELAVRHASAKPTVILAQVGTNLPFDVRTERIIEYVNDMQGSIELKESLNKAVKSAINETEASDNPVYRVVKDSAIRKMVARESPQDYILNLLQEIDRKISIQSYSSLSPSASKVIGTYPISIGNESGAISPSSLSPLDLSQSFHGNIDATGNIVDSTLLGTVEIKKK